MSDIHALSGPYAVDALDEFERHAFERHLAHCDYCRGEVDSLREASTFFSELTPVEPPAGLRGRVLAEVAAVRPLPPLSAPLSVPLEPVTSLTSRHRRRGEHSRRRVVGLVAAAAAIGAIGLGAGVTQPWADNSAPVADAPVSTTGSTLADIVLTAPDAEVVRGGVQGGSAVLVRSRQLNKAVLVTSGLDPLPADQVYEAWFKAADGALVPAGLMSESSDGTVVLDGDAATASAVGVTIEPDTGSTVPTTKPDVLEFEPA